MKITKEIILKSAGHQRSEKPGNDGDNIQE